MWTIRHHFGRSDCFASVMFCFTSLFTAHLIIWFYVLHPNIFFTMFGVVFVGLYHFQTCSCFRHLRQSCYLALVSHRTSDNQIAQMKDVLKDAIRPILIYLLEVKQVWLCLKNPSSSPQPGSLFLSWGFLFPLWSWLQSLCQPCAREEAELHGTQRHFLLCHFWGLTFASLLVSWAWRPQESTSPSKQQ